MILSIALATCAVVVLTTSCLGEPCGNPHVVDGLELRADGTSVIVNAGRCEIGGKVVTVSRTVLAIEPAPNVTIKDEPVKLSPTAPASFHQGTALAGPNAHDINALQSYVPGSLVLRRQIGGEPLTAGKDYLVSDEHGMVGIGPEKSVTPDDTVYASYDYSLMRIASIDISPEGKVELTKGAANITVPTPPALANGWLRLANVFRPYRKADVAQDDIYDICGSSGEARTGSTPGLIPRTLSKLKSGEPVTIVCLGDSVTAGGNASAPRNGYVNVFEAGLRGRFPNAKLKVVNVSVGGSSSRQWLYPEAFKPAPGQTGIDFSRVTEAHPQLVTVEFVNDAYMDRETVAKTYSDLLGRIREMGAECILITPHFTHPAWMGLQSMRSPENRAYVIALRQFANAHGVAVADAAARWENLWREGIPYLTLLHNSVNHPDDRGHLLFAEELWKCFGE